MSYNVHSAQSKILFQVYSISGNDAYRFDL